MDTPTTVDIEYQATSIFAWITLIHRASSTDQSQHLHAYGLTPAQYGVLALLLREGPLTFTSLSRETSVHPSTFTRLVDRLEQKGLASRDNSGPDRRETRIVLSERGREILRETPPVGPNSLLVRALSSFTVSDRGQLVSLLARLGTQMGDTRYTLMIDTLFDHREDIATHP